MGGGSLLRRLSSVRGRRNDKESEDEFPTLTPACHASGAVNLSTENLVAPEESEMSERSMTRRSSRASMLEWLRDVLPNSLRLSSSSRSSQRSQKSPPKARTARWADDAPLTAVEMASVAHQEAVMKQKPAPPARLASMSRMSSRLSSAFRRSSASALRTPRKGGDSKKYPAAAPAAASAKGRATEGGGGEVTSCNGAL